MMKLYYWKEISEKFSFLRYVHSVTGILRFGKTHLQQFVKVDDLISDSLTCVVNGKEYVDSM